MRKKYNILFIAVTTITGGGTEYIFSLAKEFKKNKDFNITIVAPNDGDHYINLFELNNLNYINSNVRKISIWSLFDLIKICKLKKINLIHSNGKGAGIYSRILKLLLSIPVIHSHHGFHLQNLSFFYRKFYLLSEIIFSNFTDKYIFVSNSEKCLFSNSIKIPNHKKVVIFNGIHPERLNIKKLGKRFFNINNKKKIILCISRISPEKGLETIINSIPYLLKFNSKHDFKILIVGDKVNPEQYHNDYKYKLLELINKLKVERFIQILPENKNIIDLLEIVDIYISTSKGEGFSLALLEAMLIGKPIIATNVSGNKDALKNGFTGILIKESNPFELAENITKLLDKPYLANSMGLEAKKFAEKNFTFNKMYDLTKATYLDILKN